MRFFEASGMYFASSVILR